MMKKAQFLLLSIVVLVIAMFAVFSYIETSSESSSVLFTSSYSSESMNLFRSITQSNEWLENNWYNFSSYPARRTVISKTSSNSSFNISVPCPHVKVTNSSNTVKNVSQTGDSDWCEVSYNTTEVGDYVYYSLTSTVSFSEVHNITLSLEESPLYHNGSAIRSKLCEHLKELYKERRVQLNCTISV